MKKHILAVGYELDGAGADVIHRARCLARRGADRLALFGIERRRRRFLDHFLVPTLQRAFTLEQRQQIAVAVADHLHLDMAWIQDEFFDQHAIVAERGLGLALGADHRGGQFGGRTHDAHAASAAPGGSFYQHRKANLVGGGGQRRLVLGLAVIARHQRHAGLLHQHFRTGLRTHRCHHRGGGTDEHQARIDAGLRKFGILRQEAIAGMHSLRATLTRGLDHPLDIEIAVTCPRRPKQDRLIGHRDMHGVAIGLGIDRDRAQAHRLGGADDADGDLAAVGDQQGAKPPVHFRPIHRHILNRPNFVGSIGALAAADSPRPSTSRVSAGSITPSSHSRAVA